MKYLFLTVTIICFVFTGCGKKVGEKIAEKQIEAAAKKSGVDASVDISDNNMTIKTKDGTATYSTGKGVKIPENFPKDVYILSLIHI